MFLFVSLSLTFGQQVFLPLIWNLKHWRNLDLIISGSQDQHFKMDEMQANCPLEPEGVNAFKITHTFLLWMRWPLQNLPRTSQWLLIQMKKLYEVMPTKTIMSYSPPPVLNAPAHNLQLHSFFVFIFKEKIHIFFLSVIRLTALGIFSHSMDPNRVHICHDHQPPFFLLGCVQSQHTVKRVQWVAEN